MTEDGRIKKMKKNYEEEEKERGRMRRKRKWKPSKSRADSVLDLTWTEHNKRPIKVWKVFVEVSRLCLHSLFGRVGELVFPLPTVTFPNPWIIPQAPDGVHIWFC